MARRKEFGAGWRLEVGGRRLEIFKPPSRGRWHTVGVTEGVWYEFYILQILWKGACTHKAPSGRELSPVRVTEGACVGLRLVSVSLGRYILTFSYRDFIIADFIISSGSRREHIIHSDQGSLYYTPVDPKPPAPRSVSSSSSASSYSAGMTGSIMS